MLVKEFAKIVMKRPAMYVGSGRLDYVECFLSGHAAAGQQWDWDDNYEMQRWIFDKHGAALHGSLNGWTLWYRYLGTGGTALGEFGKLLHAEIPKGRAPLVDHWHEEEMEGEALRQIFVDTLLALMAQSQEEWDIVRGYVHKESYFTQLRFVYHTPGGWRDDSKLREREENHERLVRLHALLQHCTFCQLYNLQRGTSGVYFDIYGEDSPKWKRPWETARSIEDDQTLLAQYRKWHTFITASY